MYARNRNRGLTLIELLVVVTLLGFVAATVTVQLSGRLSQAALGQAVSQWEFTDAELRLRARRKGRPVTLHLEIGSNSVECALDPDDDSARTVRSLGRGVKLTKYCSATRTITYGPLEIAFRDRGTSETYVVELTGKQGKRWIMVAGITGQTSELSNEREVEELFDRLLAASVHAG
jgi:prepilin-type N-terminal cleavage/methylation domain-containing protein